jgi:hypothetical protein
MEVELSHKIVIAIIAMIVIVLFTLAARRH